MKFVFSIAVAWLLFPFGVAAQDAPDDRYIAIYDLIQQADGLVENNNAKEAQAKYAEAQTALVKFQKEFPTWNVKIVEFRLNYLAGKTGSAQSKSGAETTPETTAKAVEPPPAAATLAQVKALREDLQQAENEKAALEAKLKAAAANDPSQSLTEAQAKIQKLTDENQILKSSLRLQKLDTVPTVDPAALERASAELAQARSKLEDNNKAIAALTQEKENLQKQLTTTIAENKAGTNSNPTAPLLEQLKQVEVERADLQARLRAALAAQANSADARQLAQAEEKLKQLQKENALLRAGLEKGTSDGIRLTNTVQLAQNRLELETLTRKLKAQTEISARLAQEKAVMEKQLAAANHTAKELEQTRQSLATLKRKYTIQTEAAIILISEANLRIARQAKLNERLTQTNLSLQKQLSSLASNAGVDVEGLRTENARLTKQLAMRKTSNTSTNQDAENQIALEQLQTQLAKLRAKVKVLEATPVPFTAEELALFRRPEAASLASTGGDKKTRPKLPEGATDLIADAQRLFTQRNYAEARAKYLEVLQLDSRNVYTLGNLATIELELNELADAEKHLQAALALKPNDGFSLGVLGNLRFRQGKYDQALDALSHAAELNPKDPEIQNFLGVTLSEKGQRASAEAALRKAIQLDPEYGSAHNNLAVIYLTQNPPQVELARWHYQKALAAGQGRNAQLEKMLEQSAADNKP